MGKGKAIVERIKDELLVKGKLDFKQLERDRGFLVYLSRTYRNLCPYLKGIHQILDFWRSGRDSDGWKLTKAELLQFMTSDEEVDNSYQDERSPASVLPASRLKEDLEALAFPLNGSIAKRVPVRLVSTGFVHYGMGDTSGNGYGAAIHVKGKLHFRYGDWSTKKGEISSNYRELNNLVVSVKTLYEEGILKDCELFLFTDNFVADCAYYKGSSSSRALFLLVLRLRKIQMTGDMIIHLIHISGKRMIASNIDGLSIGVYNEGVMRGIPMLKFLLLHLSADERSSEVIPWLRSL